MMKRTLFTMFMFKRYLPRKIIKGNIFYSEKITTNEMVNTFKYIEFIRFGLCREIFVFFFKQIKLNIMMR